MINQSNKVLNNNITKLVNKTYQYGFSTNIEKDIIQKGLNEQTVNLISKKKERAKFFTRISFKSL
jgi:Fe-S cluster assembly protein SufB